MVSFRCAVSVLAMFGVINNRCKNVKIDRFRLQIGARPPLGPAKATSHAKAAEGGHRSQQPL